MAAAQQWGFDGLACGRERKAARPPLRCAGVAGRRLLSRIRDAYLLASQQLRDVVALATEAGANSATVASCSTNI
jgi:hypothetical protein